MFFLCVGFSRPALADLSFSFSHFLLKGSNWDAKDPQPAAAAEGADGEGADGGESPRDDTPPPPRPEPEPEEVRFFMFSWLVVFGV